MASESMPIRGPDCLPFDTVILRASPSWLASLRPIRIPGRSMVALRPRVLLLNHEQGARVGRPDQRLLKFAVDSLLEEAGFEPSVPRKAPGVPAVPALVRAVFRLEGSRRNRWFESG